MNTQSGLLMWVIEAYQRLQVKSPKFFHGLNQFNIVLLLLAGLPTALTELVAWGVLPADWQSMMPERWLKVLLRIVSFCAGYGVFIGKLTIFRTPVDVTSDGKIVNVTDVQKLPFTAKKEAEHITQQNSA